MQPPETLSYLYEWLFKALNLILKLSYQYVDNLGIYVMQEKVYRIKHYQEIKKD